MSSIQMAGPWVTEVETEFVLDALSNGWYGKTAYSYVERFEREFADYHGRRFGLMTPNCTTALHLLLAGMGIGPEDDVIAPECTWIGSTAGISYVGANTIFADIDKDNWCLTPQTIQSAITERTKAVIVVDLYGNMPEWDKITDLCQSKGITVIEDAAEAVDRCTEIGELAILVWRLFSASIERKQSPVEKVAFCCSMTNTFLKGVSFYEIMGGNRAHITTPRLLSNMCLSKPSRRRLHMVSSRGLMNWLTRSVGYLTATNQD